MCILKYRLIINKLLELESVVFAFVLFNHNLLIVEMSYGFGTAGIDKAPGYWDSDLNWHEEKFHPEDWMVENIISLIKTQSI